MTIARNIELIDENWSGGTAGVGCLFKGNAGTESGADCGGSSEITFYGDSSVEFGSNRNGMASLTLSNNEEIWDLSGNIWEWVDWDMENTLATVTPENRAYVTADTSPLALPRQFGDLDANIGATDEMSPNTWQATNHPYGENVVGRYWGAIKVDDSGGAAQRGGGSSLEYGAGPFTLSLLSSSSNKDTSVGFRCVYRPKPTE